MPDKSTISRSELVRPSKYDQNGGLKPLQKTILPFRVVRTGSESKALRDTWGRGLDSYPRKHPYHGVDMPSPLENNQ